MITQCLATILVSSLAAVSAILLSCHAFQNAPLDRRHAFQGTQPSIHELVCPSLCFSALDPVGGTRLLFDLFRSEPDDSSCR